MAIHFPKVPATFIHIPKTGGTSLQYWTELYVKECIYLTDNITVNEMLGEIQEPGTIFSFVRNPFERIVSMFHQIGQYSEERLNYRLGKIKQLSIRDDGRSIEDYIKEVLLYKKGFDSYVRAMNNTKTQVSYFEGRFPDIVLRTENLNEEFKNIQSLLGCYEPFPHVLKSKHTNYRDYYTTDTRKIIENTFKEDLEVFGYTF